MYDYLKLYKKHERIFKMLRNILINTNILLIILVLSLKSIEIKLITLYSVLIVDLYILYTP